MTRIFNAALALALLAAPVAVSIGAATQAAAKAKDKVYMMNGNYYHCTGGAGTGKSRTCTRI